MTTMSSSVNSLRTESLAPRTKLHMYGPPHPPPQITQPKTPKLMNHLYSSCIIFCSFHIFPPPVPQIYDIQTGQKTLTLNNPALANNYKRNCATFNPTDDLVLNDGVLWDVRASRAIHKFDKFNMNISGVFHPNGLEVIVNTEIVSSVTSHPK